MKNTYIQKRRKVGGFTLLELLVVVGILAIIAGAIIAAYDGFQQRAARQTGANTVASLTNTVRNFTATSGGLLPNNLESLIQAAPTGVTRNPTSGAWVATAAVTSTESVGTVGAANAFLNANLQTKLAGPAGGVPAAKILTATQVGALTRAGITTLRYADPLAFTDNGSTRIPLTGFTDTASTGGFSVPGFSSRTIQQTIFGDPTTDANNSAAGYTAPITTASTFMVWGNQVADDDPAVRTALFENQLVNAPADDVLVAFGVGKESTLVRDSAQQAANTSSSLLGVAKLASAPFYGAVLPSEYNHYILLVNVTVNSGSQAEFVAVIDPRGNSIDDGATGR